MQRLSDRQHANDFPEFGSEGFRDPERPGPAAQVPWIFPDGFDAAFEEVDAVAEGQRARSKLLKRDQKDLMSETEARRMRRFS